MRRARTAVGIMVKAPEPGEVKTRLCPPLTADEAAAAATAMLTDTLAVVRASGYEPWVVVRGDELAVRAVVGDVVPLLAQRGEGLADRLAAAQADLFAKGYERVALVGGDCPTVTTADLRDAVDGLTTADVTLVPAVDGGYALVATAAARPELFVGVAMGTAHTHAATVARAQEAGLSTRSLRPRYDLDTSEALVSALRAGQLDHAPATRRVAERLRGFRPAS